MFAVLRELQSRSLFICGQRAVQSGAAALKLLHPLRPALGHCVLRYEHDSALEIQWTSLSQMTLLAEVTGVIYYFKNVRYLLRV